MMGNLKGWLAIMVVTAMSGLGAAQADNVDSSSTLLRIKETGAITLGHRASEIPFSYVVDGKAMGYSIDLCLNVVDAVSARLGLEEVQVHFVPVTPANRFILLRNGDIDLECGVTTSTAERRQQATFSYPHFLTTTRYVSLAENDMHGIADLAGRSVVSTTGTINIEQLNNLNRTQGLHISVMLSRSHEEGFSMVATRQASAFVMDDILLAGLVSVADNPSLFRISEETLSEPEPYGLMMPRDDPLFAELVNSTLRQMYQSNAILTLYDAWFLQPIPPDNRVVGLPLSPELATIFANPEAYVDERR
ncbi:amino acid ABC transporter substrate-binding protein [Vreelandella olivaria]|uniref:amino acid ABC transporter substrate-binding protein n=1 Tax=Vreelandella olivaria TaxID=390919 RepID=UPI00201F7A37|nr:amino acid ABC transporter substrate-binding protein [Halomonas olivaria]